MTEQRVIKFRAWNKVNECMYHFDTTTGFKGTPALWGDLQQYTGLKDKNGVEIFEGDLLKVEGESGNYNCFEVFYHDNDCIGGQNIGFCINRMHMQGNSAGGRGYKFTPNSIHNNRLIVCGNIYEDPELLND